jgi:flagellar M-ring protein FliF
LLATWSALDLRRRIVVAGATAAMFLAIVGVARMANTPSMSLLYSGLDGAAAGEVVAALEARGIPFEVAGDSIRVPADQRDMLRMTLAAEGLPAAGSSGYELLDGLPGFGTTSQMFDAAYWRAIEGELARTVLAVPGVRSARVHIARAPADPFRAEAQPTASVTVTMAGGSIDAAQARALRHLVAAAVAGLKPEDVAVIDSLAGLVPSGAEDAGLPASAEGRAAVLRANVERLLAARVGAGKAVVEVSVDLVSTREEVTERRFDPQGRVAISTETEERSDNATGGSGAVTVASNLPDGDAAAAGGERSQSSETRERTNFEVSETQRAVLRLPGDVRRMTVAVLVDGVTAPGADGTAEWQPRPEEELAALRELVASAVGLDEARGDVLTLKSLPFEPLAAGGAVAEAGAPGPLHGLDLMTLAQTGLLALVALVLGLFVLRPILTRAPQAAAAPAPLALAAPPVRGDAGAALSGEIEDGLSGVLSGPPPAEEDPVARLRRLIEERRSETVEVLRGWMERDGEKV